MMIQKLFLSSLIIVGMEGYAMMPGVQEKHDFSVNVLRRNDLIKAVKQAYPDKEGFILLFAGFEGEARSFQQESSFFYMTGIVEPGVVLKLDLSGKSTLYIPNCGEHRSKWMFSHVELTQENAKNLGIDEIKVLGQACVSYQFHPFFPQEEYSHLLQELKSLVEKKQTLFTLSPNNAHEYVEQRLVLQRLEGFIPGLSAAITDISPFIAQQRRIKDMKEINKMLMATEITMMAQEAAARSIEHGVFECEVQASLEYIFTAAGASPSFPSIVAGGKNGTILHYTVNADPLKSGDLVVVDIGAEYENYCADLTRTFPVSGKFTKRQREIYNLVLQTQEYVASIAKPGYWLNNKEQPEKSLNHLAREFLAKKGGYDKYFLHGIGHYLGLDVHDVGDYRKPLEIGDVITIEPGIYIAEENIGVRIEDDYWVVKDGVMCLSEGLPKKPDDIEAMMKEEEYSDFNDELGEEQVFQA